MPSLAKAIWGLFATSALQVTQNFNLAHGPNQDLLAAAQQAFIEPSSSVPASQPISALDGGGKAWTWKACAQDPNSPAPVVDLHTVNVSPDPPQAGKNMTVQATGTVRSKIDEGAYGVVDVKIGFIRLLHRQIDICEQARENGAEVQCPVEAGDYDISQTVELPSPIPPAQFGIHFDGFTSNDEPLLCLDLTVDFRRH
ncbi:hypothetical protein OC845_001940 [Tilletia horrida]|nr:hypothetical protein OC845_001940 [Tilletia horrida]